jgi:hypothetical protein
MSSPYACKKRVKDMKANPNHARTLTSICAGTSRYPGWCPGPNPITPKEVKVSPAPPASMLGTAPQPAQDEISPLDGYPGRGTAKTVDPGVASEAALARQEDPEPTGPGSEEPVKAEILCRCQRGPVVIDKRGRSQGVCRECMRDRARHANAKRAALTAQARKVIAAKESLDKELPPKPEPPLALVKMLKSKVEAARTCLVASAEAGPEQAQGAMQCVLVSAGILITMLECLVAAGGIPGWGEAA